ncbi:MAG: DUF1295 domain-containing protein [Gemmatimonadetes bacterium]|nr:DUF1295 domain-containing protein [Gemmatimonadota bacterium]
MLDFLHLPLTGTPFGTALEVCVIVTFVAWLVSVITREVSTIDRLWSLCPPVYCLIVAFAIGFQSVRVDLVAALVVLWGVRLTFNFARKGGYRKGGEDYRWAKVRENTGPVGFQVLNITFIHPVQMLLLWLMVSPIHRAWQFRDVPLGPLDYMAAGLFLVFWVGEAVADRQMWDFQQDKKQRIAAGEDVAQPFLTTGLFRYSRHPNYFCEIAMWWVIYLFAVAASGEWLHWTGLGCIGLTLLLIPSLRMTEEISAGKYPGYRDYQATTPALIPRLRPGSAN